MCRQLTPEQGLIRRNLHYRYRREVPQAEPEAPEEEMPEAEMPEQETPEAEISEQEMPEVEISEQEMPG